MKITMKECLMEMANEMRWGISDAFVHSVNFLRLVLYAIAIAGRTIGRVAGKLYLHGFAQIDAQLSRKGTPSDLISVVGIVFAVPALAVRLAVVGIVAVLWAIHAPQVVVHAWTTFAKVEQFPNKNRTPKKSRPWQRLDDFDDVRVRVSELAQ